MADGTGPGPVLAIREVSVRFQGLQALDAVDLEVAPGEVHGLIGPNGAGKTTTFNVITGLQRPTRGSVVLKGEDVTRRKPHQRSRLGLGRTFQRLELFGTMTARENVQTAVEIHRRHGGAGTEPARLVADALLERLGIAGVAAEPAESLPTGTARLVEVARALATEPAVLLLDEPSSGLNATETSALGSVLTELAAEGMGILLVEHDMELVMSVCHRVDVLDHGQILARGEPQRIRNDPAVQEAYLGSDVTADGAAAGDGRPPTAATAARPGEHGAGSGSAVPGTGGNGTAPALSVRGVKAAYGRIEVVHGVSLEVPAGSAMALLGPNGAGKSTLLKVVCGLMAPTEGSVDVNGVPVGKGAAAERLARAGVCLIPEGRSIFPNLTVTENLLMYTFRGRGCSRSAVEDVAYQRFGVLAQRRHQLAGTLSGGEQRMLSLARALATDPQILLIDELSMGLAPLVVEELYGVVANLVATERLTVFMVEQFAQTALAIADRAAIMVGGAIVEQGDPAAIREQVVEAYLGED